MSSIDKFNKKKQVLPGWVAAGSILDIGGAHKLRIMKEFSYNLNQFPESTKSAIYQDSEQIKKDFTEVVKKEIY